jgi:hypothetical protein
MGGREYMVVPMVMLTEGVHNGNNGPLFYPHRELGDLPERWDHKPVVINHPTNDSGESVSACKPDSVNKFGVGVIMNTRYDRDRRKLRAEAWLEENRLKQIAPRIHGDIMRNKVIEVSTGLFSDNRVKRGRWNGERFIGVAENYKPDHLAILTDGKGACSVADGAGLFQLNRAKDRPDVVMIRGKVYSYRQTKNRVKRVAERQPASTARKSGLERKKEMTGTRNSKRIRLAKKKIVNALIGNKKSDWEEDDREALMALKLARLKKMSANEEAKIAAAKKAAAKKVVENEDDGDEEEEGDAKAKKVKAKSDDGDGDEKEPTKNKAKKAIVKNKKVTVDQWLEEKDAPPELKRLVHNSIKFEARSRARLVKTILANSEDGPWSEDDLKKLDTETLNKLSATITGRTVGSGDGDVELDFSGQGFGGITNEGPEEDDDEDGDESEDLYIPPSTFNAEQFKKSKK